MLADGRMTGALVRASHGWTCPACVCSSPAWRPGSRDDDGDMSREIDVEENRHQEEIGITDLGFDLGDEAR